MLYVKQANEALIIWTEGALRLTFTDYIFRRHLYFQLYCFESVRFETHNTNIYLFLRAFVWLHARLKQLSSYFFLWSCPSFAKLSFIMKTDHHFPVLPFNPFNKLTKEIVWANDGDNLSNKTCIFFCFFAFSDVRMFSKATNILRRRLWNYGSFKFVNTFGCTLISRFFFYKSCLHTGRFKN